MDLPSKDSLLSHILRQLDADPSALFTGCDEFGKDEIDELLQRRILVEAKIAESLVCRRACNLGCDMTVVPRGDGYYVACPRGQTTPERVSKDAVRQFQIDVTHFARTLCEANGIECAFDLKTVYAGGIFNLGRKDIGGGSVEFALTLGLNVETAYISLLNLRTHIRAGNIVALSPTFGFSDARQLNHLHAESVYPMSIIGLLEYPDKLILDSNRMRDAIAPHQDSVETYTLLMDTARRIASYKGISLKLQPTPFEFLLHLARHAGEVVRRATIYDMFWPQPSDGKEKTKMVYDRQIDDHIRHIRNPLREALSQLPNAAPEEKADRILETKKKVGFQLNIPRSEIRIV